MLVKKEMSKVVTGPVYEFTVDVAGSCQPGEQWIRVTGPAENLRLISDRVVDTYSLETIIKGVTKPGMTNEEKATALWQFACNGMTPQYFPYERGRKVIGHDTIVKQFNMYGAGDCGYHSYILSGLFKAAGFKSRLAGLGGHGVAEAFYDGDWHMFDSTHELVYIREDNRTVANCEDITANKNLIKRFVNDGGKTVRNHYFGWYDAYVACRGPATYYEVSEEDIKDQHRMNLSLRRYETFIRWFEGRGHYNSHDWRKPKIEYEPMIYGNGELIYAPDLSRKDFRYDLASEKGIVLFADDGRKPLLHDATPGEPAHITFMVNTPYVITDAHISGRLYGDVKVAVSVDQGNSWQDMGKIEKSLDISSVVKECYSYQVKFEFVPLEDQVVGFDSVEFSTWVQVLPISLPVLLLGANHIRVLCDSTEPFEVTYGWTEVTSKVDTEKSEVGYTPRIHIGGFSTIEILLKDREDTPIVQMPLRVTSNRGKKDRIRQFFTYYSPRGVREDAYPYIDGTGTTDKEGIATFIFSSEVCGMAELTITANDGTMLKSKPRIEVLPFNVNNLFAESQRDGIYLRWDMDNRVARYEVHCSKKKGFTPSPETCLLKTTGNRITLRPGENPIERGENYHLRVMGVDARGNWGWSREVSAAAGNMAYGCAVTATSSRRGRAPPEKITDGRRHETKPAWRGNDLDSRKDYIIVDLDSLKEINRIVYDNVDVGWGRACHQKAFTISVSEDGKTWRPVMQKSDLKEDSIWVLDIPTTKYRYLKVDNVKSTSKTGHQDMIRCYVTSIEAYHRQSDTPVG